MSSYIKLMFKYIFQSDDYPAQELASAPERQASPSVSLGQLAEAKLQASGHEHQQVKIVQQSVLASALDGATSYWRRENSSSGWLARQPHCLSVAQLLAREAHLGNVVRSASELEALLSAQIGANKQANASELLLMSGEQLHDCFSQIQASEYYAGYDILVGLRIASTLTILFVVFILFVIYKTNKAESQSSLALPSVSERRKMRARRREHNWRQATRLPRSRAQAGGPARPPGRCATTGSQSSGPLECWSLESALGPGPSCAQR